MNDAVAGGNFVALDDLVAEPGSNIKKNIPDMIQYSKKYVSDETNALYVLPAEVMYTGQTVPAVTGSRGLLRWDLYADMGYPEINSADDYINVLADMQAKYPTAPDGSKVYGMAIPSNMLLFTILKPAQFWAGHDVISNFSVVSYNYDMEFINIYSDEGAYWKGIDFFHKAYLKGLLDPDSFTLTENDMKKKATDGKLLYITAVYNVGDMPEGQGFMTLPNNWGGHDQSETPIAAKIANPPSWIAINKKSDKIDLCKKYLEFVYSEEGVNLVYNGIEGTHYTVENGVRVMTPEAKELYKDQAAWTEAGLGTTSVGHFMGINKSAVMSDGVTAFVALDDSNFKDSLTPVQQDFCEHYGVDYPSQIYFKYTEEYKLPDLGDVDPYVKAFLPVAEGEIVQLQAAVIAEAESLMAGLIMASEDEYEAKIAEAKKRFEKAGLPEVDAYFKANWQSAFDKAAEFKK